MKIARLVFALAALAFGSTGWGQGALYPLFGPSSGIMVGDPATPVTSSATSANVLSLWSGTCSGSTFLNGAGVCTTPAGTGVTSVAQTVPAGFSVTGSPITSTGTLAIGYATGQTANRVLATPDGTTGALSLRALVAGDIPPINLGSTANGGVSSATILLGTNGGTSNGFFSVTGPTTALRTFTFPNASATVLTTNAAVTVPQGGTGLATLTANGVVLGEGASNPNFVVMGADTVLRGTASADPVASAVPNCGSGTTALNYSTSTHAFGCQTITAGGTGTVTSVGSGVGITASPNPIISTGTLAIDQTFSPSWSGQHTFTKALTNAGSTSPVAPIVVAASGNAGLVLTATNQTTDSKSWDISVQGLSLIIQSANDAGTTSSNAFSATRTTGTKTIASVDLGNASDAPAITGNGVSMTPSSGTYTATFNGFSTGLTRTGTWYKIGNIFCTAIPSGTATSNATTFSISGLPAAASPVSNVASRYEEYSDNSVGVTGYWRIPTGSTVLTIGKTVNGGAWTASGSKGIDDAFSACWPTN